MSDTIKVTGGIPLQGIVTPVPNKNAIVAALPAALLSDKTITYHNVPKSTDVIKIIEMIKLLGAEIEDSNYMDIKINCRNVNSFTVDKVLGNLIRASVMFAGPLLARFGQARIPIPGGCVLGKRSIAAHIDSFMKAGIEVSFEDGYVHFKAPEKPEYFYEVW
ncbi:MAG: hypothetical protein UU72_C0042G0001, partial [candidate division WWE3 bacterium GW2011_GWB1_41_6]